MELPGGDARADVVHGRARVVTPDGRPTNKNVAVENVAAARTTRSSPAGRTHNLGNLPEFRLRAGPRTRDRQPRLPIRRAGIPAAAVDTDSSAPDDVLCLADSLDTPAMHATAASDTPLARTRDYSSGLGEIPAETSSRIPSAGTAGHHTAGCLPPRILDQHLPRTQTEAGPREPLTPTDQASGRRYKLLPEALSTLPLVTPRRTSPGVPVHHPVYTNWRLVREPDRSTASQTPRPTARALVLLAPRNWYRVKPLLTRLTNSVRSTKTLRLEKNGRFSPGSTDGVGTSSSICVP